MCEVPLCPSLTQMPNAIALRHLRYFVAATEEGSFRKAALSLSVQESSVSRRIRNLEDQIGASLFHRHSSGVALTVAGERFLPAARKALRTLTEGTRDIQVIARGDLGSVRIGIFSSLASGFLADLFQAYGTNHVQVRMDFIDGSPADHLSAIRRLEIDVAFLTGTSKRPDYDSAELWSEKVFVALPEHHHLTAKTEVKWTDLADSTFIVSDAPPGQEIHDFLVMRLAELGHHPQIEPQCVGRDNLLPLVAFGRGLTVTSESTTAACFPGVAYRPIEGERLPFCAVWSPRNDNPAFRRLLSLAKHLSKSRISRQTTVGAWPSQNLGLSQ